MDRNTTDMSFKDFSLPKSLEENVEVGRKTTDVNESIYNESYFEDDYWQSYDEFNRSDRVHPQSQYVYKDLVQETSRLCTSTPASKSHGLPLGSFPTSTSTDHWAMVPVSQSISNSNAAGCESETELKEFQFPSTNGMQKDVNGADVAEDESVFLTDEEIEKLPPLLPDKVLNIVFELTLDGSDIRADDFGAQKVEVENEQEVPDLSSPQKLMAESGDTIDLHNIDHAKYREKRPHDINVLSTIVSENLSANVESENLPKTSRLQSESGYESNSRPSANSNCYSPTGEGQVFNYPPTEPQDKMKSFTAADQSIRPQCSLYSSRITSVPRSPPFSARKCLQSNFDRLSPAILATVPEVTDDEASSCSSLKHKEWVAGADANSEISPGNQGIEEQHLDRDNELDQESFGGRTDANRRIFDELAQKGKEQLETQNQSSQNTTSDIGNPRRYSSCNVIDENNNIVSLRANTSPSKNTYMKEEQLDLAKLPLCFMSPLSKPPTPLSTSSPLHPLSSRKRAASKRYDQTPVKSKIQISHTQRCGTRWSPRVSNRGKTVVIEAAPQKSIGVASPDNTTPPKHRTRRCRKTSSQSNRSVDLSGISEQDSSISSKRDLNNNEKSHPDTSDDEGDIEVSSPTSRDYLLLKRTADAILRRIPSDRVEMVGTGTAKLIEHLHRCFHEEMAETSGKFDIISDCAANKRYTNAPRTVWELKLIKEHRYRHFEPSSLTVSNCIGELRGSFLVNDTRAVVACIDFAFQNLHYLALNSEDFLTSPPEVVLLILCNDSCIVRGPHGFPLSYKMSEREVLMAARKYAIRNRTGDSVTDRRLRHLLLSAIDPCVWPEQPEHLSALKPPRQHHNIVYEKCGPYLTDTNTRQEHLLLPHLSKTPVREPETGVKGHGVLDRLTSQIFPRCRSTEQRHETVVEVCNTEHQLRKVYFRYRQHEEVPFITGIGLQYAYKGKRKLLALGTNSENDERDQECVPTIGDPKRLRLNKIGSAAKGNQNPTVTIMENVTTEVKLGPGEHVTGLALQGNAVLHNVELFTNRGRRVRAHPYTIPGSGGQSSRWTLVRAPSAARTLANGERSNGPFCLQALQAEVKTLDSSPSDVYMRNVNVVWAALSRGWMNPITNDLTL